MQKAERWVANLVEKTDGTTVGWSVFEMAGKTEDGLVEMMVDDLAVR